jgi:hypothetical protein
MWRASGDEVRGVILVMEEGGARDIAKLGEAS